MAKKIGLGGRGLDALIDNNERTLATPEQIFKQSLEETPSPVIKSKTGDVVVQLSVDKLVPNPGQPRKIFDDTELQELAASIKTHGVLIPILAANAGDGTYIIVAGERRTRAARIIGLKEIPAIIRDYTDQKRLEVSLIENIQRTDLNPIEEAAAYKNLMDFSNVSQDELAFRVGKSRSTVANSLRLLKLPIEMQKSLEEGKISSGHARTLLSVADTRAREKLFNEIITQNISVREAEKRASNYSEGGTKGKKGKSGAGKGRPPEVDAMVEKFIQRLGTKVVIEGDLNKGRILIDYYSMEDLERLYEILA